VLSNLQANLAAAPADARGPVVALQPSHQDDTGGAGWHEYLICGDIARRTIALLSGSPVPTLLAWETGMGLTGSNNDGSNARAFDSEIAKANDAGADYFVSIHNDGGAPSGVLGMYFTGDARSAVIAEVLARSISRETGLPYRGIRGRALYSLDPGRNHAPLRVLLEIGDNVRDRSFLEDPAGRQRIAAALAAELSLLSVPE
jgi:N-acetylmuramoyl-L-alanine amidase